MIKAACPRCGRGTTLDSELGDFPTRCERCGALVRRRSESSGEAVAAPASTRIQRGMLAGLLISRSDSPTIIHANPTASLRGTMSASHGVLRPESKREVLRAKARQKAIARAELRGNQQALKALTWAGVVLIGLLGVSALALKARAMWIHPTPARADVLQVSR